MPKHEMRIITGVMLFAFAFSTLSFASPVFGQGSANRILFGNKAVQEDLQLSEEQRTQINQIVAEMEKEIAKQLKSARLDTKEADAKSKNAITSPIVEKFGNRAMEVLDEIQQVRFWQIGAQMSGVAVFQNNRAQRVLRLTKDQMQSIETINKETTRRIAKTASSLELDSNQRAELVATEQKVQYDEILNQLSDDQRKAFDKLLGKKFDLELLKNVQGKKGRSLIFVFDRNWRNGHSLLANDEVKNEIGLSSEQQEKLNRLFRTTDERVTAVRLEILKGLDVDFSELDEAEKTEVGLKIVEGVRPIFRETEQDVAEILNTDQLAELDRKLIQVIGVRAIGSKRVALLLGLTVDQRRAFAEAEAEFERKTSPLRVVRSTKEFDRKQESRLKASFETTSKELLTPKQLEKLELLMKN